MKCCLKGLIKLKIAHICTTALSHKILIDKLNLLANKGYQIDIISSREGYNSNLFLNAKVNVKFIDMSREISLGEDLKSIKKLTSLFKQEDYDIVHTHTAKAGIIGRIAASRANVPLVLHTSHGLPFYEGQSMVKKSIYKLFEKIGSRYCDGILSQNEEDMRSIKEIAGNKKVYYEGNGVDLEKLNDIFQSYTSETKNEVIRQFNIYPESHIFLMGARFESVKDHKFLLEGLYQLKSDYKEKNFVCLLAGGGPLEEEIKAKIKELNLDENVIIIGYQNDIYKFIHLADTVLLTSEKEGIPRIIMESMAAKKMVVATDVLGTRELIDHEKTGILVPYREVPALSLALKKVMNENTKEYGVNARKRIENHYTEEHVVDRIDQVYKELWKD